MNPPHGAVHVAAPDGHLLAPPGAAAGVIKVKRCVGNVLVSDESADGWVLRALRALPPFSVCFSTKPCPKTAAEMNTF
jgi:hypothetical protein